jgi:hypothetical protein
VFDTLVSRAPGDARTRESLPMIACPWHGWEYDMETGQSFMGVAGPGVRRYDVKLEPGRSLAAELEAADPAPTAAGAGRVPGRYLAETFEVFVEDEYVVVEA